MRPIHNPACCSCALQSRKNEVQSLRPVTVKQLVDQVKDADDDQLTVDGTPLSNVTVLGKIVAIDDKNTSTKFTIDDGTGRVDIIKWKNDADEAYVSGNGCNKLPGYT